LIKEKIELKPIQKDDFGDYVMIICKYSITVLWLFVAVPAVWLAADQLGGFFQQPTKQDGFRKKPPSPIQIRPPPPLG
jgi:hypothetical protein